MKEIEKIQKELAKEGYIVKRASEIIQEDKLHTGIFAIDFLLDGGISMSSGGHRIEFFGAESTAKTTFSLYIIKKFQELGKVCAFIDAEKSYDRDWADKIGVNNENLLIIEPDSLEQAGDILVQIIPQVDLIVIDSVVGLIPEGEAERTTAEAQMALSARINALITRKIYHAIGNKAITMIFINQLRERVGNVYGNPYTTGGGHCFDDQTRILTKEGFKFRHEIKIGDLIPTINLEKKCIEDKPITNIFTYHWNDKLYSFNTKSRLGFLFTPHHKCLVKKFIKGKLRYKSYKIIEAEQPRRTFAFPVCFPSGNIDYPISDKEIQLIGWLLTDSTVDKYKLIIYQTKFWKEIKKLLDELEILYHFKERKRFDKRSNKINIGYEFSLRKPNVMIQKYKLTRDKLLPDWIMQLSDRQSKIFFETVMMADGTKKKRINKCISKGNIRWIERVVHFLVTHNIPISKFNKPSKNKECWQILLRQSDYLGFNKTNKKYNGLVWDIQVNENPLHFIERNGCVIITHNSLLHFYNTRIEFKKGKVIEQGTGDTKEKIGVELNLQCVKNKKGKPYRKAAVDFYLNGTLDNKKSLFFAGVKYGLIQRNGNTYEFAKIKSVGQDKFIESFQEKDWQELETEIWKNLK